ncbi:MAG: ABC transporter permease [Thermoplasmata archaeon]
MVGLVLLILFGVLLVVSVFYNAPATSMPLYCGTFYGGEQNYPVGTCTGAGTVICTYPVGEQPPAPNCYPTDPGNPSFVGPTLSYHQLGPLPLGSLATDPASGTFYNLYSGLLKGSQWSISISVAIVGVGAVVGLLLGAWAGMAGGLVDETIMRITDVFLSVPQLLLVLVLIIVLEPIPVFSSISGRIGVVVIGFAITWWPFYTRIVRAQVIVVREQKYVEAARASGASMARILRKHIVPNSMFPVFVQLALDVGTIPLVIGSIVFLGVPLWTGGSVFPEWGTIAASSVSPYVISDLLFSASSYFPWWQILFPGLILFLFAISVNFFSDGLRDALDPRLRR